MMRGAGKRRRGKGGALWFEGEGPVGAVLLLVVAAGLDFVVGDPWGWPHPVQAMGWVIGRYSDRMIRWAPSSRVMKLAGVGLAVLVIGGTFGMSAVGLTLLAQVSPALRWVSECVLLASCFAGRSLRQAAEDVLQPLSEADFSASANKPLRNKSENSDMTLHDIERYDIERHDIEKAELEQGEPRDLPLVIAREKLALYVGRDTEQLSVVDVYRAVLETVSENAIDGVLAPLFYAISGSLIGWAAPMALAYKAASTLDSMVGYREAPYTDLGWFSAQFEDGLTWLPCRLSVVTVALLSGRPRTVLSLCWRDARSDPSPNAGWSECAYAAALGVQLGGVNTYRGQVKRKPTLGEATRPITASVIHQALTLTRRCFWVGLLLGISLLSQLSNPYLSCF